MPTIDRDSRVPLYCQLKQVFLEKINNGEWCQGDLIPSEQELQALYNVSRTTIRQTLGEMVSEGQLIRQQGRGTFIAQPPTTPTPIDKLALDDYLNEQNLHLSWQILDHGWIIPSEDIKPHLQLGINEQVYCIRRLRLADKSVIGYYTHYIHRDYADEINFTMLEAEDPFAYMPLLSPAKNIRVWRAIASILAETATARLLHVAQDDPLLQLERLIFSVAKPIEFLKAFFRSDRFKYQFTL